MSQRFFICTHKDFNIYPINKDYTIISGKKLDNDYPLDIIIEEENELTPLQPFYGEGTRIKYVRDNVELPDYIGFCHYHRFFAFGNNIPNMDEIFKEHDAILFGKTKVKDSAVQYSKCHNVEDLNDIYYIVINKYPNKDKEIMQTYRQDFLYTCNMFIMKKEDFIAYCDFVFPILDEYVKKMGYKNMDDVNAHIKEKKEYYLKKLAPNNNINYQNRYGGFLLERLSNIFFALHFKNPKVMDIATYSIKK